MSVRQPVLVQLQTLKHYCEMKIIMITAIELINERGIKETKRNTVTYVY